MNLKLFLLYSFSCFMLNSMALADDSPYNNNACISCHQDLPGKLSAVVDEWKQSIHFQNNVACDGCHGGDPSVKRDQFDNEKVFKERSHLQRDREFFLIQQSKDQFTSIPISEHPSCVRVPRPDGAIMLFGSSGLDSISTA